MRWTLPLLAVIVLFTASRCSGKVNANRQAPKQPVAAVEDLASARQQFVTKLRVRGPAPQPYRNAQPPVGVKEVEYTSGDLKLKGWLSANAYERPQLPAVVCLHGGFAFDAGDWEVAELFVDAGFVLFMPRLRGENGNSGHYESFLGEVDDVVAAGRFIASLPGVDSSRVFVTGHSVGGVLTCLASMLPSPYRAAASLDGHVNMETMALLSPAAIIPYDRKSKEEVRVRNPMAFVASIRCPLRLYAGPDSRWANVSLAAKARKLGKDCELIEVSGDHQAMVVPAMKLAINWFREFPAR